MKLRLQVDSSSPLLTALTEFRFELRSFLHFSERAAVEADLHPEQRQLLLQVAGAPTGKTVTVAHAAERQGLKHDRAFEPGDRSEREGLRARIEDASDKRRGILQITREGWNLLGRPTESHARELNELGPRLAEVLKQISAHADAKSTSEIE